MQTIAVIGAGITGITTAYALAEKGYSVTVFDRNRYPAMETSFANGGQLSASNAEVWNNTATLLKGIKWMLKSDAPLLLNPLPSWHKYSWMAEFVARIPEYRANTVETTRLAIASRRYMAEMAERENIDFHLEKRGILHIYRDKTSFDHAMTVSGLLAEGGLERRTVTPDEMRAIEPTLHGDYYGGFFTESDSTGDIHKFTRGLAEACMRKGVLFVQDAEVRRLSHKGDGIEVQWLPTEQEEGQRLRHRRETARFDGTVICAGVASRRFAAMLGDRVNIYPVKGYSITVQLDDEKSQKGAPWVSLLDDATKIVSSRLGQDRFRVAGTAEFNGDNRDIRQDRIRPLVEWTRQLFPDVDTGKVLPWAGLRPMMPNMMPRVGAGRKPGVFYNTGHGHLGWTLCAATAEMIADVVARRDRKPAAVTQLRQVADREPERLRA
ncbi:D-amino-acid dehydrogenase [Faunimonas pinastri]|uniref:D-amino-acid dehydrogenase n=1 Tax=Faunimonas pinastri TaxID=1855383 RepID=A0A1H9D9Y1_9HYPH|nr:D-amino acid dehydrogenase [Faunimonas pinastri]SEQ09663.1 D-amino-acid dehydrogenase [Faunimonas pinastri]